MFGLTFQKKTWDLTRLLQDDPSGTVFSSYQFHGIFTFSPHLFQSSMEFGNVQFHQHHYVVMEFKAARIHDNYTLSRNIKKKNGRIIIVFTLLTIRQQVVAGFHTFISILSVTGSLWQALRGLCRAQLIKRAHVKNSNMNYYVENYKVLTQFSVVEVTRLFSSDAHEVQNLSTNNIEALSSGPEI